MREENKRRTPMPRQGNRIEIRAHNRKLDYSLENILKFDLYVLFSTLSPPINMQIQFLCLIQITDNNLNIFEHCITTETRAGEHIYAMLLTYATKAKRAK